MMLTPEFPLPEAARISRVDPRNLTYWVRTGLLRPRHRAKARGRWTPNTFDFAGLVAIRTVGDLRAQKVSLQKIRRALEILRANWPEDGNLGAAKLVAGGKDVFYARSKGELISLLEAPGQGTWRFVLDVGRIAREVREVVELEMRHAA